METCYFGKTLVRKRRTANIMAGLAVILIFSIGCGILTVFLSIGLASPIYELDPKKYYIAAEDTTWDYAPLGGEDSATRYKKAVFREYTDDTFTSRKPKSSPYLGILGPVIKAEVGDELEIILLNGASHNVSLHAHGVLYDKKHEGAHYEGDGVEHGDGDIVQPGYNHTYHWRIPAERGPTASDENCILFAYHSHVIGDTDIHTGLIGPLIICKQGHATETKNEFVLMFLIFDESQSWYAEENNVTEPTSDDVVDHAVEDEDSHKFHSVNGYSSRNLQGLSMCVGDDVTWHLMGMGNEEDIHSVSFEGHTLVVNGHRTDVVHLYPGKFVTAKMRSHHQGTWPIKSQVIGDQSEASMEILTCTPHNTTVPTVAPHVAPRRTRTFYIAAEEKQWNYHPSAAPSEDRSLEQQQSDKSYFKAMYVQYKDESFREVVTQPDSSGFLGPTLRVEVGELLEIHFLNRASRTYSLRSTAFVNANHSNGGEGVLRGKNGTFRFHVGEEFAPTEHDPQCITWRYFSDVDAEKDQYSGLNGVLLTCRQGVLDADGKQKYVDTEHVLMLANMDENDSHYSASDSEESVLESNRIHSINGFTDGTLPKPRLCAGGNNSVHVITIGKAEDLHVVHFIGNKLIQHGNYRDTIELLPGSHVTAYVVPSTTGTYPLRSETTKDMRGGMRASYDVVSCSDATPEVASESLAKEAEGGRKTRSYYIAAVEIEWDYAPSKINPITGKNLTESDESEIFVRKDATHIGSKYRKVVYREFTDETFENEKPRSSNDLHLGIIGPVIKAEIGDKIRVVFANKASRGSFNLRPHGVSWQNDHGDGGNTIEDDYHRHVAPGETIDMEWTVPPTAGPTHNGFNCLNWMYYSTAKTEKDTNSGLVGPLVVCKPGTLNSDGSRNDVDKEFSVLFSVFDENESWYLQSNVDEYCSTPHEVRFDDDDFVESNKIHAVNGRIYGNLEGLSGKLDDRVAWYLMGLGSEIDLHTAHFHGLSAVEKDDATLSDGRREDVVDLFPGISRTVEMTFDNLGTWLFHCHVDDHLKAGMFAFVNILQLP